VRVRVLLFASLREAFGRRHVDLELDPGSDAAAALRALAEIAQRRGSRAALEQPFVLAINDRWADPATALRNGDVLVLVPPVSGGSPADRQPPPTHVSVRLTFESLDADRRDEGRCAPTDPLVDDGSAGARVVFEGRTRDVDALEYEAHPPLALVELEAIARTALQRHHLRGLSIEHRLGRVPRGETSLRVVAAARHRSEAFAAACEVVDEIKARVAVWKVEIDCHGRRRASGQLPPRRALTLARFLRAAAEVA